MTVLAAQRCYADRSGPWLVWLHGLWGNKEEWLTAAAEAGNYPSLLIDLPGHGGSQSVRAKNFPHLFALLIQYFHFRHLDAAVRPMPLS